MKLNFYQVNLDILQFLSVTVTLMLKTVIIERIILKKRLYVQIVEHRKT